MAEGLEPIAYMLSILSHIRNLPKAQALNISTVAIVELLLLFCHLSELCLTLSLFVKLPSNLRYVME